MELIPTFYSTRNLHIYQCNFPEKDRILWQSQKKIEFFNKTWIKYEF